MIGWSSEPETGGLFWLPWFVQMNATTHVAIAPLWIPFAVTVTLSVLGWRRSRHRPGHCRNCSYNLTGNVSGLCPECGTRVPQSN